MNIRPNREDLRATALAAICMACPWGAVGDHIGHRRGAGDIDARGLLGLQIDLIRDLWPLFASFAPFKADVWQAFVIACAVRAFRLFESMRGIKNVARRH